MQQKYFAGIHFVDWRFCFLFYPVSLFPFFSTKMIKKSPFYVICKFLLLIFFLFFIWFGLFCLFLKSFLFLLFHGNKFFPLDMTEISAVKAIFCLRSRTEIKNATCVNFKLSELYGEDRLNQ